MSLTDLETRIRNQCQSKGIRIRTFFDDFDKLRSGFVTGNQFIRTLWMNLGLKLTEEETSAILDKYDLQRNGRVHYKSFCSVIDPTFDDSDFSIHPSAQIQATPTFYGSTRSVRPLSPSSEDKLLMILQRLNQHYQIKGFNIRTVFKDFDKHNVGVVTESQFYRGLPVPADFTEAEISLITRRYMDPERAGLVNYLNMYNDLLYLYETSKGQSNNGAVTNGNGDGFYSSQQNLLDPSVEMILDKIRICVHKNGIRLLEFFKDYDKLRHDLVTSQQFINALVLAVGKEGHVSVPEAQKLANFFAARDGSDRVKYREFVYSMDAPFHVLHLEKKPTTEAPLPPRGALSRTVAQLSSPQEQDIDNILSDLRRQVYERRISVQEYFKDYDRSKARTRVMTPSQFGRSLHFLTLDVTPEQLKLLARKFADPSTGDVNYTAFVQAVDPSYTAGTVTIETPLEVRAENSKQRDWQTIVERPVVSVGDEVALDELMIRIRYIVLSSSCRIKDFFEDFDTLRSGKMSRSQFRRCLTQIGLSKLGKHDLTTAQYDRICQAYVDPVDHDKVCWKQFVNDIDSVFTLTNLEKQPQTRVPPSEIFVAPKPGTAEWSFSSEDHRKLYEEALTRLRQKVAQRRILVKPTFKDFDKHRKGSVSRTQFRQIMTMLDLHCETPELEAIEARFINDEGFNYVAFMEDLEPEVPIDFMYAKRLEELRKVQQRGRLPDLNPASDADQVIERIKTKVFRERIRVQEFLKDYDKLRSGRIKKTTFRRALSTSGLNLCEAEFAHLENYYQSRGDPEFVDWMHFVDEIESVFAQKNLEKDPLAEPQLFRPPPESTANYLPEDQEETVLRLLSHIAHVVKQRRTMMLPFFSNYDKVHNGTLSQNQFRRVLTDLDIVGSFTEEEWFTLFKKFRHRVGTRDDINYFYFMDTVYALAGFEPRKP